LRKLHTHPANMFQKPFTNNCIFFFSCQNNYLLLREPLAEIKRTNTAVALYCRGRRKNPPPPPHTLFSNWAGVVDGGGGVGGGVGVWVVRGAYSYDSKQARSSVTFYSSMN